MILPTYGGKFGLQKQTAAVDILTSQCAKCLTDQGFLIVLGLISGIDPQKSRCDGQLGQFFVFSFFQAVP